MTTHTIDATLWLPEHRDQVFSFFADALNLGAITPPWMVFSVLTPRPIVMRVGTLIDYRLRVHGIPLRWQSEITVWDPPYRFVDEQRHGPYRSWTHTHTFEAHQGGTLCRDNVRYAVPGGRLINWLLVRRDLKKIFTYRQESLRGRFPAASVSASPVGITSPRPPDMAAHLSFDK